MVTRVTRAFATEQPPAHADDPVKSTTASVLPDVSDASVPDVLLSAFPPQNPNASFVPSGENLGVTPSTLLGQFVTVFAVPGFMGS